MPLGLSPKFCLLTRKLNYFLPIAWHCNKLYCRKFSANPLILRISKSPGVSVGATKAVIMTSGNEKPDGHSSASNLERSDTDTDEQNDLPKDIKSGADRDTQNESASQEARDPNLVEWDGPNDPENPLNWPSFKRTGHVVLASVAALFA